MINTDIKTKFCWLCPDCEAQGRRVYLEDADSSKLDMAVSAHKARHRLEREQRENTEREGMD